ncbi:peptidylprolyl isomerase [Caulobacter sp. DWR1-3-2b1]|uniref:peptidylprolyl isomerase n=1 Tax=Caulobacter sp. DWR1-3-2b1 TaxID=2804670 RepID=UPI003CEFE7D1
MYRRDLLALAIAFLAKPVLAEAVQAKPEAAPAPAPPKTIRVDVETGQGKIVIELYVDRAPITTANFLRYVDQKRYDGATFFRASRAPGAIDYGLIQGGLQGDPAKVLKPIAHEPTTRTGIKHTDGVVSIARNAPGTATSDFFICVGDAPYLDADPAAQGDNAGFAAFGKVVEGMDVVRRIINLPTPGVAVNPVMKGQILDPPVPILRTRRAPIAP